MSAAPPGSHGACSTRGDALFRLALGAVVALHVLLLEHFLPLGTVLADAPLEGDDFDTHIGQTWRVVEGLDRWGKAWVYDVKLLAGQPEGTIFDGDNKGWSLWTFALWRLGVPKGTAFNLFAYLVHIVCPLALFLAARLFGFRRWACLAAAFAATSVWFFDSFLHWSWWVGMIAYAFGSVLSVLAVALFYRFTEDRRTRHGLLFAPLLGVTHLVHPYSFLILLVPLGALYLRAFASFGVLQHALVSVAVVVTLAMNAYWLHDAFTHWHYVLDSGYMAQSGASVLVADFFNVLRDPIDSGVIGTRAGFRFLYFAMAVMVLWRWRGRGDRRLLPLGAALALMFGLAYFGVYVPGVPQVQPYRHVLPATLFAALCAAALVEEVAREPVFRHLSPLARGVFAVAAMAGGQHLARDVLYFVPALVPKAHDMFYGDPSPVTAYGYLTQVERPVDHVKYGFPRAPWMDPGVDDVIAWVERTVRPGQRILVERFPLGERIAWRTRAEVMGGFPIRNIAHSHAFFFRQHGQARVAPDVLENYLRAFAIAWVIYDSERPDFDRPDAPLERVGVIGGRYVYRTRVPVSAILAGPGEASARTNAITVRRSDPTRDVVLSYHWHEALSCRPDCRVERQPVNLDRVGFIRVPAPHPAHFLVYNAYR